MTWFLAPYVNSYKRFLPGTFAPTKIAWSVDNRTAGYRLVGEDTKGVRIECRIPGSDINPYLACAAQLAAGLTGIEEELSLRDPVTGDVYGMKGVPEIPHTLRAATETLRSSEDAARARWATGWSTTTPVRPKSNRKRLTLVVTDWEIARGFERA